jgi:uncharacterized membrane protein YeaQ/YmgE (transglycosylase-associated protein family)
VGALQVHLNTTQQLRATASRAVFVVFIEKCAGCCSGLTRLTYRHRGTDVLSARRQVRDRAHGHVRGSGHSDETRSASRLQPWSPMTSIAVFILASFIVGLIARALVSAPDPGTVMTLIIGAGAQLVASFATFIRARGATVVVHRRYRARRRRAVLRSRRGTGAAADRSSSVRPRRRAAALAAAVRDGPRHALVEHTPRLLGRARRRRWVAHRHHGLCDWLFRPNPVLKKGASLSARRRWPNATSTHTEAFATLAQLLVREHGLRSGARRVVGPRLCSARRVALTVT